MDSNSIIDTVTFIDTVKIYDTLKVLSVSNEISFWPIVFEISKILIPAFMVFIGAWKAFQYGLEKDRIIEIDKEIKKYYFLKSHIIFSSKHLIKVTGEQIKYIDDFKAQFKSKGTDIKQIQINSSYDVDNFNTIPRIEFYKLFIEKSKQSEYIKTRALSSFDFSLKVTKHVSKNLESDMNNYRKRINELGDQYNKLSTELRKSINYHISLNPIPNFTNELIELNKDLRSEKLDDIYFMLETYYLPLLELAKKHRSLDFIQIIPDIMAIIKQMDGSKLQYYNTYDNFVEQMKQSIEELKIVIAFLTTEK